MHIVVISDDCIESGGAAGVALESIRLLRRSDLPVTLLTGDLAANPELEALGVKIVRLGGQHLLDGSRLSAVARGLYDPNTRRQLEQWLTNNDTPNTVYHLHNWHKYLSPSVFVPLRTIAHRLVLSQHDFFLVCPTGGYYNFASEELCDLKPASASCILCQCDKRNYMHKVWRTVRHGVRSLAFNFKDTRATVLAVHEGMVPYLVRGGISSDCIQVVRNPMTPWLDSRVEAEKNRDIFFVGRLESDKGVHILAQAARDAGCRCRVIGEGPLRNFLEANHPEVELLGRCSKSRIGELVASARCVVAPTLWRETFGLVALEASASGIPVIVSNSAFIAGEIAERGIGLTCAPGDVASLTDQLRLVMADDDRVRRMSESAIKHAPELALKPERWCSALTDIYEQKISRAAGA